MSGLPSNMKQLQNTSAQVALYMSRVLLQLTLAQGTIGIKVDRSTLCENLAWHTA